jgi:serine/threonine protein kinase
MDVWALGCTFAAMLSNIYPYFRGPTSGGSIEEILNDINYKLGNLLFGEYTDILIKMLEPSHINRCTIQEVYQDLRDIR